MNQELEITNEYGATKTVEVEFNQGSIDYDGAYQCGGTDHEITAVYTKSGVNVIDKLSSEYIDYLTEEIDAEPTINR